MSYLDELYDKGEEGFPRSRYSMSVNEVIALEDECSTQWNTIRLFGTGAGPLSLSDASNETLRYVRRSLMTIEEAYKDRDMTPLIQSKSDGSATGSSVNLANIVIYQFLEFTVDCYGVYMTLGSGKIVKDVYGRDVLEKFSKLVEFYNAFKTRKSVVRDFEQGEVPPPAVLEKMKN